MMHKTYFLISPKPDLVKRIGQAGAMALSDLTEPVLWSGDESDRSALQRSDTDSLVKLLFLDLIYRERSESDAFGRTFEDFQIAIAFFDAHWMLSRIALDMTVDDALEDSVRSGSIGSMIPSGSSQLDSALIEYQSKIAPRL